MTDLDKNMECWIRGSSIREECFFVLLSFFCMFVKRIIVKLLLYEIEI